MSICQGKQRLSACTWLRNLGAHKWTNDSEAGDSLGSAQGFPNPRYGQDSLLAQTQNQPGNSCYMQIQTAKQQNTKQALQERQSFAEKLAVEPTVPHAPPPGFHKASACLRQKSHWKQRKPPATL